MKIILTTISIVLLTLNLNAQTGKESGTKYGKGEDSVRCIRNLSLYRGYAKGRDYKMAKVYWVIPFNECPKSSKNLYIDGAKMYKEFIEVEEDQQRRNELIDTLMLIYDQRIENFGQIGNVRGRQGADLLRYRRNDGIEYVKQGYEYLKESIEHDKEKASKAVIPTYLSASITLGNEGEIEAKQVIEDYILVTKIIDAQIAKRPNDSRLTKLKESLDANFIKEGPGDCEELVPYFEGQIADKKDDPAFLEMLTTLLYNRECTDNELYFSALKDLHNLAPSASSAVKIAALAKDKGLHSETLEYLEQALQMETEETKKAAYYLEMAVAYQKTGKMSSAREAALKAAQAKDNFGEPYILIGQLYAESKDACTNASDSKNLPNAVYWLAVDMFKKAKSVDPSVEERANKLILTYSPFFPNKEEAFFKGWNEGETYTAGCWINVSTKVRF